MTTEPRRPTSSRPAVSTQVSTPVKVVLRTAALLFVLAAVFQMWCAATGYQVGR